MLNPISTKSIKDPDMKSIIEEVTFLVQGGYRVRDNQHILKGIRRAIKGPDEQWKRWAGMRLRNVIDELHELGK